MSSQIANMMASHAMHISNCHINNFPCIVSSSLNHFIYAWHIYDDYHMMPAQTTYIAMVAMRTCSQLRK